MLLQRYHIRTSKDNHTNLKIWDIIDNVFITDQNGVDIEAHVFPTPLEIEQALYVVGSYLEAFHVTSKKCTEGVHKIIEMARELNQTYVEQSIYDSNVACFVEGFDVENDVNIKKGD